MAHDSNLPCDGDGLCMICKLKPPEEETLTCRTCVTPWHLNCLSSSRPQTLAESAQWECPDCSTLHPPSSTTTAAGSESSSSLIAAIRVIESDSSLTDQEKAKKRQVLLSGEGDKSSEIAEVNGDRKDVLQLLAGSFNCSFCMQLPERPVTTPCGHNFCLKCFQKWVGQGKRTCAICRTAVPPKMASQPRINSSLVIAIRMAKMMKSNAAAGPAKAYHCVLNQNRPDKAYTTERAKKAGKANACSGKIFVTVPPDHFGPILAENDPERGMGVLVGETWEDRMECRQWGAHLPHVAGICGQSDYGAQSVALSGGYEDDEDHGEWFLYTGSGGRDLSGNKRTNKTQSFDQKFDKSNEALRVSCREGYPVRVVRSHKEKRSAYAPEKGVRYDGIYRIEKCWRKPGIQGFKVCRYLFVRCDNDPAPWTSDDHGDRPGPLPIIKELKKATDITERKGDTSWDYDEVKGCWLWKVPPPESRRQGDYTKADGTIVKSVKRKTHMMSVSERLLKEFSCLICRKVMVLPLTTPCAHNFCKTCLEGAFAGQTFVRQRTCEGRRTLRAQKNIMKCPSCSNDISEFLQNPQVNRELMSVIESLQSQNNETQGNSDIDEESSGSDVKKEDIHEETDDKDEKSDEEVEVMDVCDPKAEEVLDEAKNGSKEGKPKPSPQKKPKGICKKEVHDKGIVPEKRPIRKLAADVSPVKPQIFDDEVSEAVQDKDRNKGTTKSSPQKKTKQTRKKKADDGGVVPEKKSVQKPDAVNGDGDVSTISSQIDDKKEPDATKAGNEVRRTSKRLKGNDGIQTSTTDAGVKTRNKKLKQEEEEDVTLHDFMIG